MPAEQEIERKFFPKELPDLSGLAPWREERYYLYRSPATVIRFQRRNDRYELERMEGADPLARAQQKWEISEQEFEALKAHASAAIVRDSYLLGERPQVTVKVYRGRHEGLVRVEVEFASLEEAQAFEPPAWFGVEMTETPLANDGRVLDLSDEMFMTELARFRAV